MTSNSLQTSGDDRDARALRIGGIGGLLWATVVLGANGARQPQPLNGAPIDEIVAFYTSTRTGIAISHAALALDVVFLLLFAQACLLRFGAGFAGIFARSGVTMIHVMIATFGATMACDVALLNVASTAGADTVLALWRLHAALLTVNGIVIGAILVTLGLASRTSGEGPRWLATFAAGVGVLSLLGAVPAAAIGEGSPMGLFGFAGFLTWVLFVFVTSLGHLRAGRQASPSLARAPATTGA